MPPKLHLPIDTDRAEELHREFGHLYWQVPTEHPIRQHIGPGVMVLSNAARRRAYVFTSGRDDVLRRAQLLMSGIRAQLSDKIAPPRYAPDGHMLRRNPRVVPALLVQDWGEDGPDAFTWSLVQKLPARSWNDPRFGQGKGHTKEFTRYLRDQMAITVDRLAALGWEIYNPPVVRGAALPGAQMAYRERREQWDDQQAEQRRNHLNWEHLLAGGSIGLAPNVDPMDRDVQRAYARYQYLHNRDLPRPGAPGSMRGHKSSDAYVYQLPAGELRRACPPDCPHRRPGQVDNALEDQTYP